MRSSFKPSTRWQIVAATALAGASAFLPTTAARAESGPAAQAAAPAAAAARREASNLSSLGAAVAAGAATGEDTAVRAFKYRAPDSALAELRRRILATQWPEKETVADSSQGVPLATMKKLARHWASDYDWRPAEARLNALPQFVTRIDGLDIHFIHVRSKHPGALPLVISHGWPGS
ncbi:MAG TPA: epoxide hydrolase N-terminal domain-containing protein, partial [Allosphingosinicella sp.]